MVRIGSKLAGFIGLFFIFVAAFIAMPASASASANNPVYCDSEVDEINNQSFGTEVPVILVHGISGNPEQWGSTGNEESFAGKVNDIPGVEVSHTYEYNTAIWWVDNVDAGPKLAKTIDCIARISAYNGGRGKVIVVGYSMGGLVAREALTRTSSDNERQIADEVGQVITIGTPHEGVDGWPGTAYNANSSEMENLADFPEQTIVRNIAGGVEEVYNDEEGNQEDRIYLDSDTLVSTSSATAKHSSDAAIGGGSRTLICEKIYTRVLWWHEAEDAPCEHKNLITNTDVRDDSVSAINKYMLWLDPPTSTTLTIGDLTTTFEHTDWNDVTYGAGGPGEDGMATDSSNGAHAFIQKINWCSDPALECAIGSSYYTTVGTAPSVSIGGHTPDSSARYTASGSTRTNLVWCFEDERVCVHYEKGPSTPAQLEPSQALLDVFANASWTSP